ncbi:MAG: GTP-binding protein [Candidatus Lokiarchaeota archaeon]|nr:GTP-binding protein [Candidatus Lokiarchaeota archaeon]
MYDSIFKIVIFGDAGCGKTTLNKRFIKDLFLPDSHMTIGVEFETKIIKVDEKRVNLMIWDFGGEERFRTLFPQYIQGAMGGILMYDITDYSSFSHISDWLSIIKETKKNIPILLLGGKLDLEQFREISFNEAKQLADSLGLNNYIECSSKTGENVENSFKELTRMIIHAMRK